MQVLVTWPQANMARISSLKEMTVPVAQEQLYHPKTIIEIEKSSILFLSQR